MTVNTILIVDTETTGLSVDKGAKLIEIGAVLYSVKHRTVLQAFSTLVPCETNEAQDINGISAEASRLPMVEPSITNHVLESMLSFADAIVAHNAKFDLAFLKIYYPQLLQKPVICTKDDYRWSKILYRKRLMDICEAYEVEYSEAHRAINDCLLLATCFTHEIGLAQRMFDAMRFQQTNVYQGQTL